MALCQSQPQATEGIVGDFCLQGRAGLGKDDTRVAAVLPPPGMWVGSPPGFLFSGEREQDTVSPTLSSNSGLGGSGLVEASGGDGEWEEKVIPEETCTPQGPCPEKLFGVRRLPHGVGAPGSASPEALYNIPYLRAPQC